MTAKANIPTKWLVPFAQNDSSRVELPVTTTDATRASQSAGFPPLTMQPPEAGGVPPQGEDFNGALNQVARVAWWLMQGGAFPYDATFAAAAQIGGYPSGATLPTADGLGAWTSTADNNTANPDTSVDPAGGGWIPAYSYGRTTLTGLTGGTVVLTNAQAAKGTISASGALTSNLVLVVPTWTKDWRVINNTSGAFSTTIKTASGSGVAIPQNGAPTRVSGDGTNVTQVGENVPTATLGGQAVPLAQVTGRLLRVTIFTVSGTFNPGLGTSAVRVRIVGGGGSGGGSPATGAGQIGVGSGGAAGAYGEGYFTTGFAGAAVTIGQGGARATGYASNPGTQSSFASLLVAPGGPGGSSAGPVAAPWVTGITGSSPATGSGYILSGGAPGGVTVALTNVTGFGGPGGPSVFGGGGGAAAPGTNGLDALAPGSGGGGTMQAQSGGALTSGAGGNGICIIEEYGTI